GPAGHGGRGLRPRRTSNDHQVRISRPHGLHLPGWPTASPPEQGCAADRPPDDGGAHRTHPQGPRSATGRRAVLGPPLGRSAGARASPEGPRAHGRRGRVLARRSAAIRQSVVGHRTVRAERGAGARTAASGRLGCHDRAGSGLRRRRRAPALVVTCQSHEGYGVLTEGPMTAPRITLLAGVLLLLAGCATVPTGPSVMVLPGSGRSFEQFQGDDGICRQWALAQTGTTPNEAGAVNTATGATIGTVV